MDPNRPSIWEQARLQGIPRRDFLRYCTWMGAMLGL